VPSQSINPPIGGGFQTVPVATRQIKERGSNLTGYKQYQRLSRKRRGRSPMFPVVPGGGGWRHGLILPSKPLKMGGVKAMGDPPD